MPDIMQAPVAREAFQKWIEDDHGVLRVRQANGEVLGFREFNELAEIHMIFVGESENMFATMDLCGMYDEKLHEFRFASRSLAANVSGLSEAELWDRATQGPNLMQLIRNYSKRAVEQKGYQLPPWAKGGNTDRQTARAGINAMASYAGVLAARGEEAALPALRDLAFDMRRFWQDAVYVEYQKGGLKQEQQYRKKFESAISLARESGQPPPFDSQKAGMIMKALSLYADEALNGNGERFPVWQCSRLALRLQEEYPRVKADFGERVPVDRSPRFMEFGCRSCEDLDIGRLFGRTVMLFNDPVSEEAVPQDWYCYHLAGRDLMHADRLQITMPEDYVGTVLLPCSLADTERRAILPGELCIGDFVRISLAEFCEQLHVPEPDMSGIFPDQEQTVQIQMGGM